MNSRQNSTNSKLYILIGALVVIILSVIIGFSTAAAINAYKAPLKELVKIVNEGESDLEKISKALLPKGISTNLNKAYKDLNDSTPFAELEDNICDSIESIYDSLTTTCGDDYKMSFKASDKQKLTEDELSDISEKYAALYSNTFTPIIENWDSFDKYDYEDLANSLEISSSDAKNFVSHLTQAMNEFKSPKITNGYSVKIKFTVQGNEDKVSSDRYSINIIKFNNKWIIDYLSLTEIFNIDADSVVGMIK